MMKMFPRLGRGILVCFAVAAAVLAASPARAQESAALKLAVINKHRDPAVADLLFSRLSASGGFALVERDQLARIAKELELSSLSRENNVRAGQLVSADALLFVEPDKTLLHLRLVETHHGERILDAVFDPAQPDFRAIIDATKARLGTLARKLRTPPRERLYVALAPIATFKQTRAFAEALATLSTLIGVRLGQNDRVIVAERDHLADVIAEKDLTTAAGGDLSSADAVVRGRVIGGNTARLRLEFQVQLARGARSVTFNVEADRTKLGDAAATIAMKVGEALKLKSPAPDGSLAAEAQQHFLSGLALLHAQSFEPALRSLETACLLDRPNEKYARTFFEGVALCIEERIGGSVESGKEVSAAEYSFNVDRLRAAMAVARNHAPSVAAPLAHGWRVCRFLAVNNERLDGDERALAVAGRGELQEFFERFCTDAKKTESKALLGEYGPIFFEDPRTAMEYLKGCFAHRGVRWIELRENVFPRIEYWDKELAGKLWSEFLDEVERDPSPEKQFSAIAARCYYDGTFPGEYTQGRGEGRESAQRLFAWLVAREENLQWVLAHEKWDIILRLWHAMHSLPIEEQDRYFETVMLKVLAKAHGSEDKAFYYLRVRSTESRNHKPPREDGPQLRKMMEEVLSTLQSVNSKLHRETLAKLGAEEWYATLTSRPLQTETPLPEVPGGVLLYDSSQTESPTRTFDGFHGMQDGDVLWLARRKAKALVVTRVEVSRRTSETYEFAVEATGRSAFETLVLARSPQFLFVADQYRVLAIPVAKQAPYLSPSSYQIIGPKYGKDDTGGSFERVIAAGRESTFRRVTAVVPGPDGIYIGLDLRTHDYSNRYGAIYRWRTGARDCELLCASDSLQPGPLNDCLPYSVAGGCAAPDGKAVYLFLTEPPRQPSKYAEGQRAGAWKFTPASRQWEQMRAGDFGSPRQRPLFVSETIFDVPADKGNDRFNLQTLEIRHADGVVSGEAEERGWDEVWEVESGVRYDRVYRVEGKKRTRLLSVTTREFGIGPLIPTGQGLAVLLMGLQTGGRVPTTRGLVYLLPEEK